LVKKELWQKIQKCIFVRNIQAKDKDIGTHFGIRESGVSQENRRIARKIEKYKSLKRK